MIQACNACHGPMPMGGGVHCKECRQDARDGNVARQLARMKANIALRMMSPAPPPVDAQREIPVQIPIELLADAAADQLAKAWGVRRRK